MKKFILCLILISTSYNLFAASLDEQELKTTNQQCAIRYLTSKQKKLWSIETNERYCLTGLVQGFTSVTIRDALNRPIQTLEGYFHKGYWLSDFPGEVKDFYRLSTTNKQQDFVFQIGSDTELEVTYYWMAKATQEKEKYTAFQICPQNPTLGVIHTPEEDFKKSLFQNDLLKQAKKYVLQKCPAAQTFSILSFPKISEEAPIIFQADVNISTGETTVKYNLPINLSEIPKPTELRYEQAEPLLTIQASKVPPQSKQSDNISTLQKNLSTSKNAPKSAVDIALLTHILQQNIKAQTVVYVNKQKEDYSFEISRPLPLLLQSSENLFEGWYLITGLFQPQDSTTVIQLISAKKCHKEWCTDEI